MKELRKYDSHWGYHNSPISVRIKPTNHDQICFYCSKRFKIGEKQVYADLLHGNGSFIRHAYYHPNCFMCMIIRLLRHSHTETKINCNICKNRFSCFTGGCDE